MNPKQLGHWPNLGIRTEQDQPLETMKSPDDKAKAQRVVDTLIRLRGDPDINAVLGDLTTLVRGDALHKQTDQGDEHSDAYIAILALREGLDTGSADVQARWQDALARARVWLSSFD
jgi:hypothetical protein